MTKWSDNLSPVMEGFNNPTMNAVFNGMITPIQNSSYTDTTFLKSILTKQKATADSLMDSAKKISPVAQKISAKIAAYDTAFETDIPAPLPNINGTLQGFVLFFFVLSFLSLAIVLSIRMNSVYVFGGFAILFIVALGLIIRLG